MRMRPPPTTSPHLPPHQHERAWSDRKRGAVTNRHFGIAISPDLETEHIDTEYRSSAGAGGGSLDIALCPGNDV